MAVAVHVKFENGDTRLLCYSDNESLSGIEISLKEELLGINGSIVTGKQIGRAHV